MINTCTIPSLVRGWTWSLIFMTILINKTIKDLRNIIGLTIYIQYKLKIGSKPPVTTGIQYIKCTISKKKQIQMHLFNLPVLKYFLANLTFANLWKAFILDQFKAAKYFLVMN